jgi:hypothetical protein
VAFLSDPDPGLWAFVALAGLVVAVLVWIAVVALVRTAAGKRIQSAVIASPAAAEAETSTPNGVGTHPPPLLAIETLDIDALPAWGTAYEARRAAHLSRGPAIRSVYRRTVVLLAIPITAVLVGDGALDGDIHRIPLWVPILLAVTVGAVALAETSSPRRSIAPLVMPLFGALWVALAVSAVWTMVSEREGRYWVVVGAVGATMALVFLWLRRARMRLEARHPIHAPFNLLFLRVFGHAAVSSLAREWQFVGPFLMLGGPDTAGESMHDMYYAFTGRANDVIVEDDAELDDALAEVASGLDSHLRYPARALQCTDSTWTAALDRLIPMAHVVAMDLSGFSSARRGSGYEIGRLVDEVPIAQVMLFVFDTTDAEALEQAVRVRWEGMAAASPNRRPDPGRLRVVNSRGYASRARSDPELADPKVREQFVDDLGDRIRGLLCDAAEAGLTARDPEYAMQTYVIDWGRTGIPSLVRRFGSWILGLGVLALGVSGLSGSGASSWIAGALVGLAWLLVIDRASLARSETPAGRGRWHQR